MRDKNKTVQSVCVSCLSVCVCVSLFLFFAWLFLHISPRLSPSRSVYLSLMLSHFLSLPPCLFFWIALSLSLCPSVSLSLSLTLSVLLSLSLSHTHMHTLTHIKRQSTNNVVGLVGEHNSSYLEYLLGNKLIYPYILWQYHT